MLSLSSIHTSMHALKLLPKPHTLGIRVHTWLVILSHVVMIVVSLSIFMMLSLAYVIVESFGLPSVVM
jgi:hypothetical protein